MPKQIRKEKIKPCDRKYRISAVAGLAASAVFAASVIGLMKKLIDTEEKLAAVMIFAAYAIYAISCSFSLALGIKAYVREDNTADLFQSLFEVFALIACLMNLRFLLIMLFSALKLDAADMLLGSQTQTEFIASRYSSWICMAAAILVTIIIGVLGIIKLVQNREK